MINNKIKLLLLSDPSSPHTIRWANALHNKGIEIYLFGLSTYNKKDYDPAIKIETMHTPGWIKIRFNGSLLKIIYLFKLPRLRRIIRKFKPDVLHAHYVSSYGILGALTNFHPFFISAWGIDIFLFPGVSPLHKGLVKFALKKADKIFSTSNVMAGETKKYTTKEIQVVPFGIDPDKFYPSAQNKNDTGEIKIGLVKSLERKYGIDKLINTFELLKSRNPNLKLKLLLIGGGSLEDKFKKMVKSKGLEQDTIFTGNISHQFISDYHRKLDIAVYLSTSESFGVSVIESSACEIPVVVSDAGGLVEVVENNKTGFVISKGDPNEACKAIELLIRDKDLRIRMGKLGRKRVLELYNWDVNVNQMLQFYSSCSR
jgi:glycosyltransferase involved in cell wall biosynthesis